MTAVCQAENNGKQDMLLTCRPTSQPSNTRSVPGQEEDGSQRYKEPEDRNGVCYMEKGRFSLSRGDEMVQKALGSLVWYAQKHKFKASLDHIGKFCLRKDQGDQRQVRCVSGLH